MVEIEHENAHSHAELFQGLADARLFFGRAVHHAVVFDGPEALFIGEFDLIGKDGAGEVFKHAVVDTVIQMKGGVGGGRRRRGGKRLAGHKGTAREDRSRKEFFS